MGSLFSCDMKYENIKYILRGKSIPKSPMNLCSWSGKGRLSNSKGPAMWFWKELVVSHQILIFDYRAV